eukprot:scaffold3421_cov163-Pinguiococcus_pyrenoidosus.AAC.1
MRGKELSVTCYRAKVRGASQRAGRSGRCAWRFHLGFRDKLSRSTRSQRLGRRLTRGILSLPSRKKVKSLRGGGCADDRCRAEPNAARSRILSPAELRSFIRTLRGKSSRNLIQPLRSGTLAALYGGNKARDSCAFCRMKCHLDGYFSGRAQQNTN